MRRNRYYEGRNPTPLVRDLLAAWRASDIRLETFAYRAGVATSTIDSWFGKRRAPLLDSFVAAAEVLGYDVILVKKDKSDDEKRL